LGIRTSSINSRTLTPGLLQNDTAQQRWVSEGFVL
jgi:hypothetical protein